MMSEVGSNVFKRHSGY